MCNSPKNHRTNIYPSPGFTNTAAVVVAYFPDLEFASRLCTYLSQFARVYVIDNTPASSSQVTFSSTENLHYHHQSSNLGLAEALNKGCSAALKDGFQWVGTLDQDTVLDESYLVQQIHCWQSAKKKPFILGCNFLNVAKRGYPPRFPISQNLQERRTVITSGSLMHLETWRTLGKFREEYFIDGVDHEMCLRARGCGFSVALNPEILMKHTIGSSICGSPWLPFVHPPLRKYYSTRNGVRNLMDYGLQEPCWALRKCLSLLWEFFGVLATERAQPAKLKTMGRGLIDGFRGRMGPAPEGLVDE